MCLLQLLQSDLLPGFMEVEGEHLTPKDPSAVYAQIDQEFAEEAPQAVLLPLAHSCVAATALFVGCCCPCLIRVLVSHVIAACSHTSVIRFLKCGILTSSSSALTIVPMY